MARNRNETNLCMRTSSVKNDEKAMKEGIGRREDSDYSTAIINSIHRMMEIILLKR